MEWIPWPFITLSRAVPLPAPTAVPLPVPTALPLPALTAVPRAKAVTLCTATAVTSIEARSTRIAERDYIGTGGNASESWRTFS